MKSQIECFDCIKYKIILSLIGLNLAASFPSLTEKHSTSHIKHFDDVAPSYQSASYQSPSLDSSVIGSLLLSSSSLATQSLELFSPTVSSSKPADDFANSTKFSSVYSGMTNISANWNSTSFNDKFLKQTSTELPYISESYLNYTSSSSVYGLTDIDSHRQSSIYVTDSFKVSVIDGDNNSDFISHFHTPLMSLLVATPSSSWLAREPFQTITYQPGNPALSLTTSSSNNELSNPNPLPVPTDQDHKKLLMLVLRAEDCTRFSKSDFEKMLSKLMAKFGFNDVIPEVSNAKCYSHLNINVTVGGPTPTLRFLPNLDGKNNFTVDVLNRTFRIVKLEKVDLKLEKTKSSNVTSNIIAAVAKHESVAYIAVGVSFGLILVICVSVCCIKCCCLKKPQKRYSVPKGTHVRLRPEDYTLTPIPRPTSLYVDYYRGSGSADIYSTTSAGSIASTTPTVEQGVVQPFDTSIVPLEDSLNLPLDSSRDPSVESVPAHSDLKTFNIPSLSGKGFVKTQPFRKGSTDSKEHLNPKALSKRVETKPSGVANPTFQRY